MAHDHTERVRVRERVEEPVEREHVHDEPVVRTARGPVYTLVNLIYVIFGVFEVLLVIRFILKLGNANTANQVVAGVYNITEPLVRPFYGIFQQPQGVPMIELATLLALAFVVLIEALVIALVRAVSRP
jgi:hypothetical protein